MPRQKKETLVHLDLDALAKETAEVKVASEDKRSSVGQILKKARRERKLHLDDVAKRLRIKKIYLEALEQGAHRAFPGFAYGVGFLRTYALFLELDAQSLIAQFHQETADMAREPMDMPIPENHNVLPSKRVVWWSVAALVLVFIIWSCVSYLLKPVPVEPVVPAVVAVETTSIPSETAIEPVVDADAETSDEALVEEAPVESDTLLDTDDKADEPQMQEDNGTAPKAERKVYGSGDGKKLSFTANAEVWIEVKDGEKVLFSKVLHTGDRYNPGNGSENWVLKTGNAGAIDVHVNGQSQGTLGESGTIKSDIILDVEFFTKKH